MNGIAVNPEKRDRYTWKQFREIYLAVVEIDRALPGTGVIDRFLADIVDERGQVRVELKAPNLQKVMSMLIMLGTLRAKAFPKVIAVLESILKSPLGSAHRPDLVAYLEQYLRRLSEDEVRNRYLISWIWYFFVSNRLTKMLSFTPTYTTEIVTSVFKNRSVVYKDRKDFSLFVNAQTAAKSTSMLQHLDVFSPPNSS